MLAGPRAEASTIARLRVRGAAADPLAARLRLEALLGGVEAPSLPPAAILCVRRVADPLPGALPLAGHALRPPVTWARALSDALDGVARRAARPAHGAVPAGAEAVVFADAAELLACLARDLAAGLAGARWWWRALYGGADLRRVLVEEWLREPESVPPALERLAVEVAAPTLLAALGAEACRALARAVAVRHGLAALAAAMDVPASAAAGTRASPLERWAPEAGHAGGVEARTLLGVAVALRRAPAAVRGGTLASGLAAWRAGEPYGAAAPEALDPGAAPRDGALPSRPRATASVPVPIAAPPSRVEVATGEGEGERRAPRRPAALGAVGEGAPGATPRREAEAAPERTPAAAVREAGDAPAPRTIAAAAERADAPAAGDPPRAPGGETRDRRRPREPPVVAVEAEPAPPPLTGVETELGGLFFLVNVGLSLGLYGDFTTPLEPGIDLPVWDFVALLGARLLDDAAEDDATADDPAWPLLARLAGHDRATPPGAGLAPPPGWRLPAGWTGPGEDGVAWDAAAPVGADPLDRWVAWLAGHVRTRIVRALALDDPSALAPVLLRRRARVRAGDTRVDVHLALAELPLSVRLAGLDRDPGWLPAGGRSLYFHFE